MSIRAALSKRLYLRIWLTVVLGVAALMLLVGWFWRMAEEHNRPQGMAPEVIVRNAAGEVIGTAEARVQRGRGLEFEMKLPSGEVLQIQVPNRRPPRPEDEGGAGPRLRPPGQPPHHAGPPWWAKPPYGFLWMLGGVGLAAAVGLYPVMRKLTQRLETLQQGVQKWGDGDLSRRVPVSGQDEVADLSQHFNDAAQRIENLLSSQRALLTSQKSLLANASHELRSPLARIRMGLEFLGEAPPAVKNEITRNIAELDQLIDEILLASRLDAQESDLGTIESVDLIGLCAEECTRVGASLQLPEGVQSVEVQGVGKLLRRMVRNLLENAKRYGGESVQEIALTLSQTQVATTVRVDDRGPGVPAELRERIFEPFYRLPGASERTGGVGLGLALVKSIALRHGGQVSCLGRDGGGASFEVTLGHAHPKQELQSPKPTAPSQVS
jgi:signal transduction histidine kinase